MKLIQSFTVNHDILEKGMYISRVDKDIVTYDIRMKKPNAGSYLSNGAMHTFEHLFATYVRNTEFSDDIVYVGPMGCRTGFYFLVRDSIGSDTKTVHGQALELVRDSLRFIASYEGEIPGTRPSECGNYREHDLEGARETARDMLEVLADWSEEKMRYQE